MKKHIDWQRMGWTIGIIALVIALWALGNWIWGDDAFLTLPHSNPLDWFMCNLVLFMIGVAILGAITLSIFIINKVVDFYYHNGEKKVVKKNRK